MGWQEHIHFICALGFPVLQIFVPQQQGAVHQVTMSKPDMAVSPQPTTPPGRGARGRSSPPHSVRQVNSNRSQNSHVSIGPRMSSRTSPSPSTDTAALLVDVATDLWGFKDNIRIELRLPHSPPPTPPQCESDRAVTGVDGTNLALARLKETIDATYTREMRATAPPSLIHLARSMLFRCVLLKVLQNYSPATESSPASSSWEIVTSSEQLRPLCQLYAFQAPSRYHSDTQSDIPVARSVAAVHVRHARPMSPQRHQDPTRADPNHDQESATTTRAASSGAGVGSTSSVNPNTSSPQEAVGVLDAVDQVFGFMCTGRVVRSGDALVRTLQERCGAASLAACRGRSVLLHRLLHAVGVNVSSWCDAEFGFLAHEASCMQRDRQWMPYATFIAFGVSYRSLVTLMQRYLCSTHTMSSAADEPHADADSKNTAPMHTVVVHRKDVSPPRSVPPPTQRRYDRPDLSPPRKGTPIARASKAQRQVYLANRLYRGLSSQPTQKDRAVGVFDMFQPAVAENKRSHQQ